MPITTLLIVFAVSFIASLLGVLLGRVIFFPKNFAVDIEVHQQNETDDEFLDKLQKKLAEVLGTDLKKM